MATVSGYSYNPKLEGGLVAGADYSAAETNLIMKMGTADETLVTAGAGEQGVGIRMNKPALGQAIELAVGGIAPLKLGGTVARGGHIKSDASGQGVASSSDREEVFGIALRSGDSGDIIPVLIRPVQSSHA
jgi:hypothetical protein